MKLFKSLSAIAIIAATLTGCSKEGATGATGPTGPTGPAGSSSTGEAVVKDSVFLVPTSAWTQSGVNWLAVIADPQITNANAQLIQAQGSSTGSAPWLEYPALNQWVAGDVVTFDYTNDSFTLVYRGTSAPPINIYVRIAVIPLSAIKQHPYANWNDYNQVQGIIASQKNN